MALLQEVLTEITCIFSGMAEMDETDIAPRRSAECLLLSSSLPPSPRHALKGGCLSRNTKTRENSSASLALAGAGGAKMR